jgi:hypothetical protein
MSAPLVVNVDPANNEVDVVLGTQITITFDQLIDTTTIDESTFSVIGPGQTQILTAGHLIAKDSDTLLSREYIEGTFAFDVTPTGRRLLASSPSVTSSPTSSIRYCCSASMPR